MKQWGGEASCPPSFFGRCPRRYLRPAFFPVPRSASATSPDVVAINTDADRTPIAAGANVMPSVQDWPAPSATLTEHVPWRVNSAGFAPPIDSDTMVSVAAPEFATVAIRAPLDLPIITVPRSSDAGLSATAPGATEVAADWETTNVRPPSVRFADRAGPALAATTNPIVAPPLPAEAPDTVSHAALLTAVHAHPDDVDSVTLPEAPPAGIDAELAPSAYAQPDAWPTAKAIPPTVSVAFRAGPLFAAYE